MYRLGDRVNVQVIKVDMERRQIDLGLVEILERVRESERNRGPRRSRAVPKAGARTERGRGAGPGTAREAAARKQRPGSERARRIARRTLG